MPENHDIARDQTLEQVVEQIEILMRAECAGIDKNLAKRARKFAVSGDTKGAILGWCIFIVLMIAATVWHDKHPPACFFPAYPLIVDDVEYWPSPDDSDPETACQDR